MIRLLVAILVVLPVFAQTREDALALAHQAAQAIAEDPAKAATLAEKAHQTLLGLEKKSPADLAACAGLTARAWRSAGEISKSRTWFEKAIPLSQQSDPTAAIILRAELGDMLMRAGDLPAARSSLGSPPKLPLPSPPLAQWYQTSAKLHLTCGLPEKAQQAITLAINALPPDDFSNLAALHVDAAGIALRQNLSPDEHLKIAQKFLTKLKTPHPEILSALVSVAAQAPDLSPEESLTILQGADLKDLPNAARLTFSVTLAEAAARAKRPKLVKEALAHILAENALPNDHPLLARALFLINDPRSAEVALRWLEKSDLNDSDTLLGIQRTVDPISPLIGRPVDDLARTALTAQNFALRKRLGGKAITPTGQTVLYLIYQKDFEQHYGALVFTPAAKWIDLGPAKKIHHRIADTIETAERTLAEVSLGATLSVRLTQLWKSIWQPIAPHLDPTKPISIAPVGMLHNVPWSTLRDRDGKYLCQQYLDVRVLSLTGAFPKQKKGSGILLSGVSRKPTPLPKRGEFPFDSPLIKLVDKLSPLPGVKAELSAISDQAIFNPSKTRLLKLMKSSPDIIHLAGHGFIIDEGGFRAGLALTDEILFAHEISSLNLSSTDLVVLSACRGGIGRSEVGGNWSSLRRSFIAAGAKQVMAAQWRVRDDELPLFMKDFHQRLKNTPAHQALWQLQRSWLENEANGTEEMRAASAGAWVLESRE